MKSIQEIKTNEIINVENKILEVKKVAAYARVSTEKDEQQTSFATQIKYYKNYIESHKGYIFVKVYTDEGISGTQTKNRNGFKEMMKDAADGKIDLIITKSISRFAKNTVDSLTSIRKLKSLGCEVYFEKENIYTFDSKGELLLTIMSSLAQEESRSLSENVSWGIRKRFKDGIYHLNYHELLGYEKGEDGNPIINEDEAWIVKRIYYMCLEGMTTYEIAKELNNEKIPTPTKKDKWYSSVIKSILSNEKYKGDALLQKTYSNDFLTKKRFKNEGIIPQYYVTSGHKAIIPEDIFESVHKRINVNPSKIIRDSDIYYKRFVCKECGSYFGKRIWHNNTKGRKVVYQCNGYKNKNCHRYFEEKEIKSIYSSRLRELINNENLLSERLIELTLTDEQLSFYNLELEELKRIPQIYTNSKICKRVEKINKEVSTNILINNYFNNKKDYSSLLKRNKKIIHFFIKNIEI